MKSLCLAILILAGAVINTNAVSEDSPFEKYGFSKVRTYTSSKGEFDEFHDKKNVVEIGTVLFDTKTNTIVGYVDEESGNEVDVAVSAMSIDPLCEKYYWISPYAYCMNNPVRYIDPDGRDFMDFIGGILHAVGSNLTLGAVPTDANFVSNADHYNLGRTVGDVVSIVLGGDEVIVGSSVAVAGGVGTVGSGGSASPVTVPAAVAGTAMTAHGVGIMAKAIHSLATQDGRISQTNSPSTSQGRGKNNLKPDSNAQGDHSTLKKDENGNITNTATYKQNPKNPSGFDEVKRVDVKGASHQNKSGKEVSTPHVHEKGQDVRPARPDELPKKR